MRSSHINRSRIFVASVLVFFFHSTLLINGIYAVGVSLWALRFFSSPKSVLRPL